MILIIIQARSNSNRLRDKIYKRINGKALIDYSIDVARNSGYSYLVAIPKHDYKLIKYLEDNIIPFKQGSENDVLDRFYQIAKQIKPEIIVRLCADYMYNQFDFEEQMRLYRIDPVFRFGNGVWIFGFGELENAWKNAINEQRKDLCNYMMPSIDYEEDLKKWAKP